MGFRINFVVIKAGLLFSHPFSTSITRRLLFNLFPSLFLFSPLGSRSLSPLARRLCSLYIICASRFALKAFSQKRAAREKEGELENEGVSPVARLDHSATQSRGLFGPRFNYDKYYSRVQHLERSSLPRFFPP